MKVQHRIVLTMGQVEEAVRCHFRSLCIGEREIVSFPTVDLSIVWETDEGVDLPPVDKPEPPP